MTLLSNNNHYSIVGQGLTGLSCVRYLQRLGCSNIRLLDSRNDEKLSQKVKAEFPDFLCINGDLSSVTFKKDEVVIVSPGVALTERVVKNAVAANARITSDIEIFLAENAKSVFTVTGSNGKSTVVTLLDEIFSMAGLKTLLAGNIGLPVLQGLDANYDVVILELSSFQLERLEKVPAVAASILNVSEDHMDRYENFSDYVESKQHILNGAESIVINEDDPTCLQGCDISHITSSRFSIKEKNTAMYLQKIDGEDWITYDKAPLLAISSLKIQGLHNISNVMAAMLMAKKLDVSWSSIINAVTQFRGLPHRCEWVNKINGVEFYNDSKATNVGAAIAAITGLITDKPMVLIAGGVDKDSDFLPLVKSINQHVKKAILFGQDAEKIAFLLNDDSYTLVANLSDAVNAAYQEVEGNGLVLLSPACASFDMFDNFEHRGNCFKEIVEGGLE